ncbi:C-GCAxxG-C-C family (seleno)protein [Clostridium sp. BJN0001]|uniref:C-GCAxxG-C-C family (seleno)protein n=1 Tax=Clostridium sp. BJN0001 TaxID=2930219 RepID=UPI001FD48800|nr:C-GCAxxG-C-C family (seleno)protein [Clostridium sp. BJN0001]
MLKETARELWLDKKLDLNCAECILYAVNKEYSLDISKETLKTMAGFGGGMGVGEICGAISGAIASISILFTEVSGHKSPKVRAMSKKFIERFKSSLGYIRCADLKKNIHDKEERSCLHMIETSAEILGEIIKEEKGN